MMNLILFASIRIKIIEIVSENFTLCILPKEITRKLGGTKVKEKNEK